MRTRHHKVWPISLMGRPGRIAGRAQPPPREGAPRDCRSPRLCGEVRQARSPARRGASQAARATRRFRATRAPHPTGTPADGRARILPRGPTFQCRRDTPGGGLWRDVGGERDRIHAHVIAVASSCHASHTALPGAVDFATGKHHVCAAPTLAPGGSLSAQVVDQRHRRSGGRQDPPPARTVSPSVENGGAGAPCWSVFADVVPRAATGDRPSSTRRALRRHRRERSAATWAWPRPAPQAADSATIHRGVGLIGGSATCA
jgi:hypothetical protein